MAHAAKAAQDFLTPQLAGTTGAAAPARSIEAAREELVGRGAEVEETFHFGAAGRAPGVDLKRRSYATFMPFNDPDGNTWLVQEVERDWRLDRGAGSADHDAAVPDAVRGSRHHRAAAGARDVRRRLAAAADHGQPDADGGELPPCGRRHDPSCLQVRRAAGRDGRIAEITTFGPELFPQFGLPPTL